MSRHVMGENPVKIIRWSGPVTFPSGEVGYMICRYDLQIRKSGRMPGICRTGSERVRSNRGGSNLSNKKADVSETPAGSQ